MPAPPDRPRPAGGERWCVHVRRRVNGRVDNRKAVKFYPSTHPANHPRTHPPNHSTIHQPSTAPFIPPHDTSRPLSHSPPAPPSAAESCSTRSSGCRALTTSAAGISSTPPSPLPAPPLSHVELAPPLASRRKAGRSGSENSRRRRSTSLGPSARINAPTHASARATGWRANLDVKRLTLARDARDRARVMPRQRTRARHTHPPSAEMQEED